MKQLCKKLISSILVIIILIEGYEVLTYLLETKKDRIVYEELKEAYYQKPKEESIISPVEEMMVMYKDMVGWLQIPMLEIAYPIMQGKDNEYYLVHDYKGEESRSGCIFMDAKNAGDFSDHNTVIYGHDMKDGTMFGKLKQYKNLEELGAAPHIVITTQTNELNYEIFAVYEVDADEPYRKQNFESENELKAFWEKAKSQSRIETQTIFKSDSKLLTLSTCTSGGMNRRLVIVAQEQ